MICIKFMKFKFFNYLIMKSIYFIFQKLIASFKHYNLTIIYYSKFYKNQVMITTIIYHIINQFMSFMDSFILFGE